MVVASRGNWGICTGRGKASAAGAGLGSGDQGLPRYVSEGSLGAVRSVGWARAGASGALVGGGDSVAACHRWEGSYGGVHGMGCSPADVSFKEEKPLPALGGWRKCLFGVGGHFDNWKKYMGSTQNLPTIWMGGRGTLKWEPLDDTEVLARGGKGWFFRGDALPASGGLREACCTSS